MAKKATVAKCSVAFVRGETALLVDTLLVDNLALLLNKVAARFQKVTRLQHHCLGLGDDTEVEHSGARVGLSVGD